MTSSELKDKIAALWEEYKAGPASRDEDAVLYLCVTTDARDNDETLFATIASRHFLRIAVGDFLATVAGNAPGEVEASLSKLFNKFAEAEREAAK